LFLIRWSRAGESIADSFVSQALRSGKLFNVEIGRQQLRHDTQLLPIASLWHCKATGAAAALATLTDGWSLLLVVVLLWLLLL
jgi:hypothetical protein